jgi:hypothetical protein
MSDVVIKVDRLSKLYHIGFKEQLPEAMAGTIDHINITL